MDLVLSSILINSKFWKDCLNNLYCILFLNCEEITIFVAQKEQTNYYILI